ncbi:MAG: glutamate--tRNA ligase family protein [Acidobacteriota bacterium]
MLGRFAPSTTGEAHPGTLLSALLVWLDARSRGGRVLLRLEDLDRDRVRAEHARSLVDALAELGLDWDEVVTQSERAAAHEAALDRLAAAGRLYPCTCSRAARAGGRRAPDGGWAYDNTCRDRPLPSGGWRAVDDALRARLPDDRVELVDDAGLDLSQTPALEMGDPVVRRRDGAIAYQLAVVVDDAAAGVTDVVRGRDIAPSTATQVLLQRLLGVPTPRYRHHLLLLEEAGGKLAKLHGSIPFSKVRARYRGDELCGLLAAGAGIVASPQPCTPRELVARFAWARVATGDRVARWDDALGLVIQ